MNKNELPSTGNGLYPLTRRNFILGGGIAMLQS
ncbi:hypothetical protein Cha6605_1683 [Chamaesiphon minutus PCC 6605]|uniref:Uncharacterized protein n=1 Tax=Chamaesiphon minutus (strain ATCC 27169 / PCC 6605) TaxID=1173020 RepID=K9UF51_CHAP6|nr:hypothetical protein Cha6605_1683 [Chamaesiphon minutus PCC 6605]